jgi:hypothetical protein
MMMTPTSKSAQKAAAAGGGGGTGIQVVQQQVSLHIQYYFAIFP